MVGMKVKGGWLVVVSYGGLGGARDGVGGW